LADGLKSMFRQWFRALNGARTGHRETPSAQLSTALLLIEIARADLDIGEAERRAIVGALGDRFGLPEGDAAALAEEAQRRAQEAVSLYDYVRSLNAALDGDSKRWLMEALWRIAYADGRVDKYEEHLLRKLADLLYLSEKDYVRAKLSAAGAGEGYPAGG
jgi:uncharacterized tellurite resistance protein B-like protein